MKFYTQILGQRLGKSVQMMISASVGSQEVRDLILEMELPSPLVHAIPPNSFLRICYLRLEIIYGVRITSTYIYIYTHTGQFRKPLHNFAR